MSPRFEPDPSLEVLPDIVRQALVAHWLRRCQSERRVGLAFTALAERGRDHAAPVVLQMLAQSAQQEQRHAQLCLSLAERYAGHALPEPEPPLAPLPDFRLASAQLDFTFQIAGLCCINETLATAWLRHCASIARVPFAIEANRQHLREEIDHARLGWAHLASEHVTVDDKAELATSLPQMLRVNVAAWEQPENYLPGTALTAHGQPTAAASQRVLREAVTELLLPGFAHVGITLPPNAPLDL